MPPIATIIIIAVVAVLIVALCLLGYVKAPPDQAFIISGFRKHRTLIGRAGVRIPFLERLDRLSLALIPIDVKTSSAVPTADYINISVDAAVNVKISDDPDKLKLASANFLNQPTDYIARVAREVLEGNMREIVGKMRLEEMVSDRQKFANLVKENAEPDLAAMGLDIISFNVQNFVDGNGVIENLGVDNIVRIQRGAAISRAESERDIKIAQATAQREANDARVEADTQMAERNNALAIRQAELKQLADRKQAEADAAYGIQEQEQRRSIEVASANADIARAERTAELKAREVEVAKQTLDAEIRARADAQRYAAEQEAEAELYRRTKEAEAKMIERQREAEGIRAVGEAEAEAVRLKALAEAEGIDKKAEAMKKYGEAAVIEMIMAALPEIARNVAEPLSKVDKITMYGEGNSAKLLSDIVNGTTQVTEGMTAGLGIDLKSLLAGFLGGKAAAPAAVPAPAPKAAETSKAPEPAPAQAEEPAE